MRLDRSEQPAACNPIVNKGGAPEDTHAPPAVDPDWPDSGAPVDTGTLDPTEEDCAPCLAADPAFLIYAADDCDGDGLANSVEVSRVYTHADGSTAITDLCDVDSDEDSLIDSNELARLCEDPTLYDSDGDGLSDGEEVALMTSTCETDSDGDGIPDGSDATPTSSDAMVDGDGDGLTAGEEYRLGTSDSDTDSDDDNLRDDVELGLGSSPILYDSDGDCYPDDKEYAAILDHGVGSLGHAIDLNITDSDGDGLLDGEEEYTLIGSDSALDSSCRTLAYQGTHAAEPDSDFDTWGDGDELAGVSGYITSPALADTDNDGLDDAVELIGSADPTEEDTDHDCLKDGEEADLAAMPLGTPPTGVAVALRLDAIDSDGDLLADGAELNMPDCLLATGVLSDPTFLHSDADEVDDGAEVRGDGLAYTCPYASCASDPMDADSDDDDVTDNTERDDGMNPTDVDSDGDELEDGDEVSWGAITGASVSHYAADGSLPDGLSGVNEVLQCTSMKDQTSTTFVQALAATSTNPYYDAQPYYTDFGSLDIYTHHKAKECVCELDFNDVRPHVVTGLSVWLETAAHSTTTTPSSKWSLDQTPAGVALYLPWQSTSALNGYVFSMDSENTQTTDTSGTEYWYAFGVSPLSSESLAYSTTDSAGVAVPISREAGALTGTQQKTKVIVSRSNLSDYDIGRCHSLAGGALGSSGYNLSVAVDSYTTSYAILDACDPSTRLTQITDFRWFKLGGAPRLMAVAGAAAHAGASPVRIEVFDWREAHSLRGIDRQGREVRLSRGQGPRNLEPGAFTLAGATWEAQGARGEPLSANVGVRVAHTCTAPPPPAPAGNLSLPVSWENLNEWASRALGLPLSALVDVQVPLQTAAFRLRIEYEPNSSREVLIIEAVGAGELDRVPVVRRADGHWSFDLQRPKLKLRGGLVRLANGSVELRIVSGEVGAPGEAIALTPFQSAIHIAPAAQD